MKGWCLGDDRKGWKTIYAFRRKLTFCIIILRVKYVENKKTNFVYECVGINAKNRFYFLFFFPTKID